MLFALIITIFRIGKTIVNSLVVRVPGNIAKKSLTLLKVTFTLNNF